MLISTRGFLVIVLIAMSWASSLEAIASEVNWIFFEEVDRSKVDRDSLTRSSSAPRSLLLLLFSMPLNFLEAFFFFSNNFKSKSFHPGEFSKQFLRNSGSLTLGVY